MWKFWAELLKAKGSATIVLFDSDGDRAEGMQNFVFNPKAEIKRTLLYIGLGIIVFTALVWALFQLPWFKKNNQQKDQLVELQQQVEANETYILQLRRLIDGEQVNLHQKLMPQDSLSIKQRSSSLYPPPIKGFLTRGYDPDINHYGLDVAVTTGTPVKSIGDGIVVFSDETKDSGFVIGVQHADGLMSVYKHNKELLKSIGNEIKVGDTLAFSGNSGEITTGPHLHFELWRNGVAIDPKPLISEW